jgi:hypothetical protein
LLAGWTHLSHASLTRLQFTCTTPCNSMRAQPDALHWMCMQDMCRGAMDAVTTGPRAAEACKAPNTPQADKTLAQLERFLLSAHRYICPPGLHDSPPDVSVINMLVRALKDRRFGTALPVLTALSNRLLPLASTAPDPAAAACAVYQQVQLWVGPPPCA